MGISGGYGQVYEIPFIALARLSGLNIFLHHHSYAYLRNPNGVTRTLFRVAGREAFHIALCEDMAERLKSSYKTIKKIGVVSNAVFIDHYGKPSCKDEKVLMTIGFLGNISPEKGIMEFLDVVAELEGEQVGINAIIAGPFQSEEIKMKVFERLSELKTARYVGPKYDEGKKSFYDSIDVLLFPTKYINEAEPLTIHEAMSSGIPVIARSMGCISSMITSDMGLVVNTNDDFVEKAFAQLMSWYSSPNIFRAASRAAFKRFSAARISYSQQLQVLCSSIASVISRQRLPTPADDNDDNNVTSKGARCLFCSGETIINNEKLFDTRYGISKTYHISFCQSCSLVQTSSFLHMDELKEIYQEYYNFAGEKGTRYTRIRERFLFSFLYRFWIAVDGDISFLTRKGSGRLLDIGCNEGRGLRFYRQNGYNADGLELNERAAEVARSHGFIVNAEPVEKFKPSDGYDVVVLSNVLEHSLDPKDMLYHARRILKPSGQLWISCPNSNSWLRTLFGRFWINWHVPFHIVHFSRGSLQRLLHEAGFEVVKIRQETPSLWVAHSIIARLFARRGKPTRQLRNPLLVAGLMLLIKGLLFPFLWLGNKLGRGDCLVVIVQKR